MHAIGKPPAPGRERWSYLAKAENWRTKRQQLHDELIGEAVTNALKFADVVERGGHEPTLFALRGNTAAGKTRMATQAIPVLASALKESNGACINPDIFKSRLANVPGHDKLSSAQVHAESCMLADRLEGDLRSRKTGSGAPASMLVDKRLAGSHEIEAYIKLAEQTGRKVELCDVDAPLERSLLGVLQRKPSGENPRPPYVAVSNGFAAVRRDRLDVIDKFIAKPELGSYHLFGTAPSGNKVKVASVVGGELTIDDPHLYKQITAPESAVASDTADKVIDTSLIDRLTSGMSDARHAHEARSALHAYAGMTWSQALQIHSSLTD